MQRKGLRRTDVHRIVMYIDDSIINRVCLNREERVLGSLPFSFGQLCTYFRTHTQVPRQSSPKTVGPPSDPFGRTHLRTPCEASPYEGCKILDVFQRLSDPLRTLSDPLSDPPSDPLRSESLLGVQDFGRLPKTFGPPSDPFGPTFGPTFGPPAKRIPIRGARFQTFGPHHPFRPSQFFKRESGGKEGEGACRHWAGMDCNR